MPFKWREIFAKENTIAKAQANKAIDDHTDAHTLLDISIRQLQDEHEQLEHACAIVLANYKAASDRLERDLEAERQLDASGKAAAQAGHTEAAAAIAQQLIGVRSRLTTEQRAFDAGKIKADEAKAAFAENGEMLAAKMAEAKTIGAEIDEAAMEHNMNEAMASVTSMTAHTTPSFDEIRDRVAADHAKEDATAQLEATDPGNAEIHQQHLMNVALADDVMAAWGTPAAPKPAPSSGSPMDRMNA